MRIWMCHSKKQLVETQENKTNITTMENPLTISSNDEDAEVITE